MTTNNAFSYMMHIIEEIKPNHVLVASSQIEEILKDAKAQCVIQALSARQMVDLTLSPDDVKNVDLVVLGENLNQLEHTKMIEVIGVLRNHLNAKMLILSNEASTLSFSDMLSLGFKREQQEDESGLTLYSYDIANYNKKREWNNSRFWANPEHFNKYRW